MYPAGHVGVIVEPVDTTCALMPTSTGLRCGVIAPVAAVAGPVPTALIADTRNRYGVPSVRPVTVIVGAVDALWANVDQATPSVEYSTR